jgi:hypothetical protein
MWRAFFSAIGIVVLILGLECLVIDQAVMANRGESDTYQARIQTASLFGGGGSSMQESSRVFRPSEWIPWSLLATGAVTVLYAASYRRP